jgi:AraC-like DNA-binding protein
MDAPVHPSPCRTLVKSMWAIAGRAEESVLPGVIAPDSHVEFVFHLGTPWRMRYANTTKWVEQPRAFVYAQSHGALRFAGDGAVSVIAFRVSPIVAEKILGRPAADLWNQPIALEELLGTDVGRILDHLHGAKEGGRYELLSRWIERRLSGWSSEDWNAEYLFDQLMWNAPDSIDSTAKKLGWSTRSLRRLFTGRAALSPKEVQLAGRHLQACALLRERPDLDVTEIAGRVGFFDHAAFTHSFRERLGLTPTEFRAERFAFYERRS